MTVDNQDQFFSGIPIVIGATGKRGVNFLSKKEQKQSKLLKMQAKLHKLQGKLRDMGVDSDGNLHDESSSESSSETENEESGNVNPLS